MADFKRQIALKVRIKDLIEGKYFREEGMNPNYIKDKNGRIISRVNLIAAIVDFEEGDNFRSMILDDGSGKISVRFFEESNANVGDVVLLIGRPREYGNEKYLYPEIIKKIEDPKWIKVRNLELKNRIIVNEEKEDVVDSSSEMNIEEDIETSEAPEEKEKTSSEKIIDKIKDLDKGDGVDIESVISGMNDGENLINLLLKEGEIFEIRPGRLKVLE